MVPGTKPPREKKRTRAHADTGTHTHTHTQTLAPMPGSYASDLIIDLNSAAWHTKKATATIPDTEDGEVNTIPSVSHALGYMGSVARTGRKP